MIRVFVEMDRFGLGSEFVDLGRVEIANITHLGGTKKGLARYRARFFGKRGVAMKKRDTDEVYHNRDQHVFTLIKKALEEAGF